MSNLEALKKQFNDADVDKSGALNRREFDKLLVTMGFKNHNLNQAIYNAQDKDDDHKISLEGGF